MNRKGKTVNRLAEMNMGRNYSDQCFYKGKKLFLCPKREKMQVFCNALAEHRITLNLVSYIC